MSTESFVSLSIGTAFILSALLTYKKKRAAQDPHGSENRTKKNSLRTRIARIPLGLLSIVLFIMGLFSLASPLLTPHIGTDFWVLFTFIFIASFLALIRYVIK